MTLAELRDRVYYKIGRGSDLSTLNTDILYALNTIQREVNMEVNFRELLTTDSISTSGGTQSYDLPTDFLKMSQIWNNDSYIRELKPIKPNEFKIYLGDVDSNEGDLYYYNIHDSVSNVKQIYFYPIPPSSETVPFAYYKKLTDLVADDDSNILTTFYPDLYIDGACWIMYRDVIFRDQPEKIIIRREEYKNRKKQAMGGMRQPDKIHTVLSRRVTVPPKHLYNAVASTENAGYGVGGYGE